ncbi:MAG TPA: CHAP domain-containing protein [Geomonas sp.]|nr:CHAP domain-containing protein [Geomonas sp.]
MNRVISLILVAVSCFFVTSTFAVAKDKKHEDKKHEDKKHEDKKHEDKKHEDKSDDKGQVRNGNLSGNNGFIEGQCTWFVAEKAKDVWGVKIPWRGNAGAWYDNAKNSGFRVGIKPAKNSIIVFKAIPGVAAEKGGVGHVGWVTNVNGDRVSIEEMNYTNGPYKTDSRTVSAGNNLIRGYIYAQ